MKLKMRMTQYLLVCEDDPEDNVSPVDLDNLIIAGVYATYKEAKEMEISCNSLSNRRYWLVDQQSERLVTVIVTDNAKLLLPPSYG